jgi:hypothetical protein
MAQRGAGPSAHQRLVLACVAARAAADLAPPGWLRV